MQINSPLANEKKLQKKEDEETFGAQNSDNNDESSIAYQPEELGNENIGNFPMLFS
jgi:hypothetical protein